MFVMYFANKDITESDGDVLRKMLKVEPQLLPNLLKEFVLDY